VGKLIEKHFVKQSAAVLITHSHDFLCVALRTVLSVVYFLTLINQLVVVILVSTFPVEC